MNQPNPPKSSPALDAQQAELERQRHALNTEMYDLSDQNYILRSKGKIPVDPTRKRSDDPGAGFRNQNPPNPFRLDKANGVKGRPVQHNGQTYTIIEGG